MIVLDASVLIAHLNPHDEHHATATRLLLTAPPGTMLVHSLTLAEVLVGGVRVSRGAAMRDDLAAAGIAVAEADPGEPLRLAELRMTTRLTMPDCCVLGVALREHAALATFDQALAEAARRLRVTVLPESSSD